LHAGLLEVREDVVYGCAAETKPATNQRIRARTVITMARNMALAAMTKPTSSADETMKTEVTECLLSVELPAVSREDGRWRNGDNY